MAERSLRHLELNDVTEDVLRQLIHAGETDLVERKEKPPRDGLGPTVSSFANSGGGWVLIGVSDDGELVGFSSPGRAEPQDWLRSVLRPVLDPLPPFTSKSMTLDDVLILVIRVQASSLTPHLYTPGGAIYIREHGGKQPINSQAALLALAVRPEQAKQEAYSRMTSLPLVQLALGPHRLGNPVNEQTRVADWIVTAAPLVVPDGFKVRALSRPTVEAMEALVVERINSVGPAGHGGTQRQPHGSGVVVEGRNLANGAEVHVLLDAGGVCVARIRERVTRGVLYLPRVADDILTPLLTLATGPLSDSGATGATHLHLHVRVQVTTNEQGWRPSLAVGTAHAMGELHAAVGSEAFFGEDIELPAHPDDINRLSEAWMREIARTAGVEWWED
jgi:hypothetical protein